jgi:5-methylcytosine-specific restriction endonuclease McrA
MPRKPDLPCAGCGNLMWRGRGVLPEGQATCQPCRRAGSGPRKTPKPLRRCLWCADRVKASGKRYCSQKCFGRAEGERRRVRALDDGHVRRCTREVTAVGLTSTARRRLLHKWQAQGRTCAYCDGPAETVDHVVPLVRGGTNHEGNLAPCCKRCNSSKAGWLVIEWRTGLRLPMMSYPLPMRVRLKKVRPITGVQTTLGVCPICTSLFSPRDTRNRYCTSTCQLEGAARGARDRYRLSVGMQVDPRRPTKPSRRQPLTTP